MAPGSVTNATMRIVPSHRGQQRGSNPKTRAISFSHRMRRASSCAVGLLFEYSRSWMGSSGLGSGTMAARCFDALASAP